MANKFEVGDRVRCYIDDPPEKGVVTAVDGDRLTVRLDGQAAGYWAHPKTCRKLMKKKKPAASDVFACPDGYEEKVMYASMGHSEVTNRTFVFDSVYATTKEAELSGEGLTGMAPVTVWVKKK